MSQRNKSQKKNETVEVSNLPNKKLKVIITEMFNDLRKRIHE